MEKPKFIYDLNDPDFNGEWPLEQYRDLVKTFAQNIHYDFFDDSGKFTFVLTERDHKKIENNIQIQGFILRGSAPVRLGHVIVLATSFHNYKIIYDSDSVTEEKLTKALIEAHSIIKNEFHESSRKRTVPVMRSD